MASGSKGFAIRVAAAIALLAPALSGCGDFEKGFNQSWSKKTHDDCVKEAGTRASADVAERYCSCVVTQLMPLPVSKKMGLKVDSPEAKQAIETCNAQLQQQAPAG